MKILLMQFLLRWALIKRRVDDKSHIVWKANASSAFETLFAKGVEHFSGNMILTSLLGGWCHEHFYYEDTTNVLKLIVYSKKWSIV